ncbi:excinuclease ABC subunit UvrB [Candidatus Poribacteria bacterium]|jgi:excinuclease ABC subunit B|nr:excinuclease ABC subunit UvrB [Candidatus Poribacteria bacterium]MBT5532296.1 excinuclease ABC subunit UvrB [Candidatus Poribacteria bacterium]MBT5715112.1 excinuclease ABC subunit UvrB [Candidatus Poribacteria bacterium]MBT7809514.1 excinuclease ABC subunit UvrB [Candidatus Poribacteria bacterium]
MPDLQLVSDFSPAGDQPQAIDGIIGSIRDGEQYRTLLGVTGSGKTFTVANAVQRLQRPALVISHNKTLAAQLFSEFQEFFPHNAVHYFVSFYDYYQPEAYMPATDTYIEKDLLRNEEIEKYRMMATASLLSRRDVIIIASVSCIYGLGSPEEYEKQQVHIALGDTVRRNNLIRDLIDIRYQRNDVSFDRGCVRARGDVIEIFPPYQDRAYRVELFGDNVDRIREIDTLTGEIHDEPQNISIFPAYHYMTAPERVEAALIAIESELQDRIEWFIKNGKLLEAQRIEQRTRFDLEMIREVGSCQGIENYSRHFDARQPGEPPFCLLNYFPDDYLLFIDESHVTIPQIRGMYNGDRARKQNLVDYGFRLPSALDNRPLRFEEFTRLQGPTTFITATPGPYELDVSEQVVEQIIRPTGLVDPVMRIHPTEGQIDHLIGECRKKVEKSQRVLVTTLTKRMSEDLTEYLTEIGLRARYLHSEINTVERTEILRDLREGRFDILVGINLLREGLDLPEVALVCILDADKEGFLRSETSLVQTAGRAARNVDSEVILYADTITNSIERAMAETERRRERQLEHNAEHGITPTSIVKDVRASLRMEEDVDELLAPMIAAEGPAGQEDAAAMLAHLEAEMQEAAQALEFEKAASLRDQIREIKEDYGL